MAGIRILVSALLVLVVVSVTFVGISNRTCNRPRKVTSEHKRAFRSATLPPPILLSTPATRIFVAIKSGASQAFRPRRDAFQNSSCPEVYASANMTWKFFVGVPTDPNYKLTNHHQGGRHTKYETTETKALQAEFDQHRDIEFVAYRDQYMDLSNKILNIFRYFDNDKKHNYIVVHDDEYCGLMDVVREMIADHAGSDNPQELYAGSYLWKGTEYNSMKGSEGLVAPFFSGAMTVLSRRLVRYIVRSDWAHSVLSTSYGTTSDDANIGKWVKWAIETHGVNVSYVEKRMHVDTHDLK